MNTLPGRATARQAAETPMVMMMCFRVQWTTMNTLPGRATARQAAETPMAGIIVRTVRATVPGTPAETKGTIHGTTLPTETEAHYSP